MKKNLVLYPTRPIVGQSFVGAKKHVIPNQCMTLQEIIRRFIKREPLPAEHEGSYHEGEYDLEKLAKEDMVVRGQVLEDVKADVEVKRKRAQKVKDDIERAMQKDPKEDLSAKPLDSPPA